MTTVQPTRPIETTDAEIQRLVDCIRQLTDAGEEIENQVRAAKERLRVLLLQKGDNYTDENGYARIAAAYKRTSYDANALDNLTLNSPWWHKRLNKYRREHDIRSAVQVK